MCFRCESARGADHGYIDGQTAPETPIPDRHIAGPTTGFIGFTENSLLLKFWSEETSVSELEHQVSQAIVPRNSVAGLLAAQGVIPKFIHGLLAKKARGRGREHRLTEETGNGGRSWGEEWCQFRPCTRGVQKARHWREENPDGSIAGPRAGLRLF